MTQEKTSHPPIPRPTKAYKNLEFLNSTDARIIRVLCEFTEPGVRFRKMGIRNTIGFFGSSRALPPHPQENDPARPGVAGTNRTEVRSRAALTKYYEDATQLARRLTEWSMNIPDPDKRFHICSGGGPGIMEAANRGAHLAGAPSAGLNISLPYEQIPNPYQSPDLAFEFHYFFVRKFWFVYLAKAMVFFPGGFGTFDELFELLTLVQTRKLEKEVPIVIYGTEYWNDALHFDTMVRWGTISAEDLLLVRFCDTVEGALEFLTEELTRRYLKEAGNQK